MARNWPAIGVNYGHQINTIHYDAAQVTADLTFLYNSGVRNIRLSYVTFPSDGLDTVTITRLKAVAVEAMAMGFRVLWGYTSGSSTTSAEWTAFLAYVTGTFATWAKSVSLTELSIGNEEEGHLIAGTEVTAAQGRIDIKAAAATVKAGGFLGQVSYSSETNNSNIANWTTDGIGTSLDYLHFNTYDVVVPNFGSTVASIKRAFGGRAGCTEWGSEGLGYATDFNDEEQYYRDTLYRLQILKSNNFPYAYFFAYRGSVSSGIDEYALKTEAGVTHKALQVITNNIGVTRRQISPSTKTTSVHLYGSNRITVNSSSTINFTATGTYSWMGRVMFTQKVAAVITGVLVLKGTNSTRGYQIYIDHAGLIHFQERKTFTSWRTDNAYYPEMLNRWIDWAVTYNGTTQSIRIYMDGVEVPSSVHGFDWVEVISDTTNGMTFGNSSASENTQGFMSDCLFYDRVLTQDEVVAFSQYVIPTTPKLYLPLSDGIAAGTVPVDTSGNSSTCSITTVGMWSKDIPNKKRVSRRNYSRSLSFNGTTDYATIPITPNTTGFSFAFWVFLPVINSSFGRIFDYYDASANGIRLILNTLINRMLTFDARTAGVGGLSSPAGSIEVGEWFHVVVTNTAGTSIIYKNGVGIAVHTSSTYAVPTAEVFTIGRASNSSANFGKFLISEIVYKNGTVFTQAEIDNLYIYGTIPTGTTCFINCDNNVLDISGNGNVMTLVSGTSYSTNVPSAARSTAGTRTSV